MAGFFGLGAGRTNEDPIGSATPIDPKDLPSGCRWTVEEGRVVDFRPSFEAAETEVEEESDDQ